MENVLIRSEHPGTSDHPGAPDDGEDALLQLTVSADDADFLRLRHVSLLLRCLSLRQSVNKAERGEASAHSSNVTELIPANYISLLLSHVAF